MLNIQNMDSALEVKSPDILPKTIYNTVFSL